MYFFCKRQTWFTGDVVSQKSGGLKSPRSHPLRGPWSSILRAKVSTIRGTWDTLSSAEVQAFVISIRCAKCTAGTKSNGSIRRRTSARCMSISRTSLSFSRTSMDFSALAKFDSLKLTETHCQLCGYRLHLFFWSLISYFLRNEAKCFTLKAPLKPVGVLVVHVVFSSIWQSIRSFTVLFKSCIFVVNINLNKTILQSIYIIFRFFLLFVCLKKFERPTANDSTKI